MCFTFFFCFANKIVRQKMLSDALNTPSSLCYMAEAASCCGNALQLENLNELFKVNEIHKRLKNAEVV